MKITSKIGEYVSLCGVIYFFHAYLNAALISFQGAVFLIGTALMLDCYLHLRNLKFRKNP